ncbi:hypothetical protein [Dactylosporangium sp. CS-033363]|uniref:hypothetical protein n=1 Tax=Dactylosporangium sp. CS-033363 TaxID=3239935 RepID=UPI003D8F87D4
MNIAEAMEAIAQEAEQQGFLVRQLKSGTWHFRLGHDNYIVTPRKANDLLTVLSILTASGLDWSKYEEPGAHYRRDDGNPAD